MASTQQEPVPTTPDQFPSSDKFQFDKIVQLKVGPDLKKLFFVHEGILCFYSKYFRAALNSNFAEAQSKVIELPTEDSDTFEAFVRWLYTRKIEEDCGAGVVGKYYHAHCKLWLLGDRREIPLLCNEALNGIRRLFVKHWTNPSSSVPLVYEGSLPTSALSRFLIHMISTTCGVDSFNKETCAVWDKASLWDMASALLKLRDAGTSKMKKADVEKLDLCGWHIHEDGVKCKKA